MNVLHPDAATAALGDDNEILVYAFLVKAFKSDFPLGYASKKKKTPSRHVTTA
jgi:hypothetical protein